jgi:homocysteine S-methyltransferase
MALYRHSLPQLDGAPFLADGGLETSLVFLEGVELPAFAAFPLLAQGLRMKSRSLVSCLTLLWQKRIFARNFKGLCLKLGIG